MNKKPLVFLKVLHFKGDQLIINMYLTNNFLFILYHKGHWIEIALNHMIENKNKTEIFPPQYYSYRKCFKLVNLTIFPHIQGIDDVSYFALSHYSTQTYETCVILLGTETRADPEVRFGGRRDPPWDSVIIHGKKVT
jgi:hypothetical protein